MMMVFSDYHTTARLCGVNDDQHEQPKIAHEHQSNHMIDSLHWTLCTAQGVLNIHTTELPLLLPPGSQEKP